MFSDILGHELNLTLRHLTILILTTIFCRQTNAQDTITGKNNPKYKHEFNMIFGYNTPVGIGGGEIAYRPKALTSAKTKYIHVLCFGILFFIKNESFKNKFNYSNIIT